MLSVHLVLFLSCALVCSAFPTFLEDMDAMLEYHRPLRRVQRSHTVAPIPTIDASLYRPDGLESHNELAPHRPQHVSDAYPEDHVHRYPQRRSPLPTFGPYAMRDSVQPPRGDINPAYIPQDRPAPADFNDMAEETDLIEEEVNDPLLYLNGPQYGGHRAPVASQPPHSPYQMDRLPHQPPPQWPRTGGFTRMPLVQPEDLEPQYNYDTPATYDDDQYERYMPQSHYHQPPPRHQMLQKRYQPHHKYYQPYHNDVSYSPRQTMPVEEEVFSFGEATENDANEENFKSIILEEVVPMSMDEEESITSSDSDESNDALMHIPQVMRTDDDSISVESFNDSNVENHHVAVTTPPPSPAAVAVNSAEEKQSVESTEEAIEDDSEMSDY